MMAGEGEGRNWEEVAEQADKVVSSVDQVALLAWMGIKADTRENAGEVKKDMERAKGSYIYSCHQ